MNLDVPGFVRALFSRELLEFFLALLGALPTLLLRFVGALLLVGLVIVLGFGAVKHRVRANVTRLDDGVRYRARGLRYRDRDNVDTERVELSWFFRFWTNFASAPALSFFSLAVPFWCWHLVKNRPVTVDGMAYEEGASGAVRLAATALWLLPGLCYAGSMLLSFVVKRVFRRVRPPREGFAFGHKLKDPSFPSGHSLTSFCFWLMLSVVVAQSSLLSVPVAVVFGVCAASIVGLTGLSRVYLGVHFPSDVLGGFLMGAVWSGACYLALRGVLGHWVS
jgi:membrane-associated phospholipid phosphatase